MGKTEWKTETAARNQRAKATGNKAADREVRDDKVPELGRRSRGGRAVWVVHVRRDGKRTKVTLGNAATIPIDRARDMARDVLNGRASDRPVRTRTVAEFADSFLADCANQWKASTLATNRQCVEGQILPAFGRRAVADITRDDVVAWMSAPSASPGSRNRALPVLSALMIHAELRGLRASDSNPCKGLRRRQTAFQASYLDADGFRALGAALRSVAKDHPTEIAALRFLALTGARRSEALALQWPQIDGRRAALPDSKTGPRAIWLGAAARRGLAALPRQGQFVFGGDAPLPVGRLDRAWIRVRSEMKRPDLRLHDLRHSFASVAIGMGYDLIVVGGLLGHSDKGSTAGYAHLDQTAIKAATKRVGAHLEKIRAKGSNPASTTRRKRALQAEDRT